MVVYTVEAIISKNELDYHYELIWSGEEILDAVHIMEESQNIRMKKWEIGGNNEIIFAKIDSEKYCSYGEDTLKYIDGIFVSNYLKNYNRRMKVNLMAAKIHNSLKIF